MENKDKMQTANLQGVKPYTLIKLAAIVWFTGVIILLVKSSGMFIETVNNGAPIVWVFISVLIGLVFGKIKAKYLFVRLCKKNIKRILALKSPKIWQFYRTRFFFFLFCMILFGNYAYSLARNNIYFLLSLAVLELSISTALFISGKCFYIYKGTDRD